MGPNQPGRPIYSPDGTSGQEQSRGCRLEPGRIVSFRQRRKKNLKHLIGRAGCRLGNSLFELSVTVWKRPGSLRRFYPKKSHKKQAPRQEKVDPNSTFTFKFTDWMLVQTRAEAGPFITRAGRGRGGRAAVRGLGHLD